MAITITITDPQDHAPYELRVLAEYFQALAYDKSGGKPKSASAAVRTTHDEELLSEAERAALLDTISIAGLEESAAEAIAGTSKALRDDYERQAMGTLRGTAGGDQEPYAVNAGGSDDFAELRDDPKPDASTPADASDGKTVQAGLDSSGLPWDERIHSSSKAQNADGTWRYKRGGDLDERKRVEAELRGEQVDPSVELAEKIFEDHFEPEAEDVPPPPADDDIPPPPVEDAEDLPPPPPADEPEPEVNMGIVFRAITEGQKAALTQDKLAECLKAVGLTSTVDITRAPAEILAPLLQLIKEASV